MYLHVFHTLSSCFSMIFDNRCCFKLRLEEWSASFCTHRFELFRAEEKSPWRLEIGWRVKKCEMDWNGWMVNWYEILAVNFGCFCWSYTWSNRMFLFRPSLQCTPGPWRVYQYPQWLARRPRVCHPVWVLPWFQHLPRGVVELRLRSPLCKMEMMTLHVLILHADGILFCILI